MPGTREFPGPEVAVAGPAGVQAGGETVCELAEWSQRLQIQICSLGEGGPGGVGSGGTGR